MFEHQPGIAQSPVKWRVPLPWEKSGAGAPAGLQIRANGNIWFGQPYGSSFCCHIGEITSSGVFTIYHLSGGCAEGITKGPDGNMWFTDRCSNKIGKITASGAVT